MPGPNKKPNSVRGEHDRGTVEISPEAHHPPTIYDPPEGLSERVEQWWYKYVTSDLARTTVQESDLPALRRLATLYMLRDSLFEGGMDSLVVRGGNGQLTMDPRIKQMASVDSAIDRLEDRFGLSPRARVNLGIQIVSGRKSLEDMSLASPEELSLEVDPKDLLP